MHLAARRSRGPRGRAIGRAGARRLLDRLLLGEAVAVVDDAVDVFVVECARIQLAVNRSVSTRMWLETRNARKVPACLP